MTKRIDVYKCNECGCILEVTRGGSGDLNCCGKRMIRQKENYIEASEEKHKPTVEKIEGGILVKVGEIEHPMTDEHYIEWIELVTPDKVYRKDLKPGDKPQAVFKTDSEDYNIRAYCNIHNLWNNS